MFEVICYVNISVFEWRVIYLSYSNVFFIRRIILVYFNYINFLVENDVIVMVLKIDEILNIFFVILIKDVLVICDIDLKLLCIVEFMDDFIRMINDIGNILIIGNVCNVVVLFFIFLL